METEEDRLYVICQYSLHDVMNRLYMLFRVHFKTENLQVTNSCFIYKASWFVHEALKTEYGRIDIRLKGWLYSTE